METRQKRRRTLALLFLPLLAVFVVAAAMRLQSSATPASRQGRVVGEEWQRAESLRILARMDRETRRTGGTVSVTLREVNILTRQVADSADH